MNRGEHLFTRLRHRARFKVPDDRIKAITNPDEIVRTVAFTTLPVSYLDAVSDALTTFSGDTFAVASSTTTVIFIPPWPTPQ